MNTIPHEVFPLIFIYVDVVSLINISEICHLFYNIIRSNCWDHTIKIPKRYRGDQIVKIIDTYNSNFAGIEMDTPYLNGLFEHTTFKKFSKLRLIGSCYIDVLDINKFKQLDTLELRRHPFAVGTCHLIFIALCQNLTSLSLLNIVDVMEFHDTYDLGHDISRCVNLRYLKYRDEGSSFFPSWTVFSTLTKLETLILDAPNAVNDNLLTILTNLHTLKLLNKYCTISDQGLKYLTSLRTLSIGGTQMCPCNSITNKSISLLRNLEFLKIHVHWLLINLFNIYLCSRHLNRHIQKMQKLMKVFTNCLN